MASGWKSQLERIFGAALRAGLLSALRNLTRAGTSGGRPAPGPAGRSDPGSSAGRSSGRSAGRSPGGTRTRSRASRPGTSSGPGSSSPAGRGSGAPGTGHRVLDDFPGTPVMEYTPLDDGLPDPGEIVWSWVAFEEDHSQGKDRPVLVIGRDGARLLGLMLTSKDHDRDQAQEARYGRHWIDIGTGDWDAQRRPSEVRVDRVLRIDPNTVRREGAVLDRARFDAVAAEVLRVKRVKRG